MKTLKIFLAIGWIACSSLAFAGSKNPDSVNGKTQVSAVQKEDSNQQAILDQMQIETEQMSLTSQQSVSSTLTEKIKTLQTVDQREKEPDKCGLSK